MPIKKQLGSMKIKRSRPYLPDDIVREILSRLSLKNLLRYKSVSQNWKSVISHHSFKKLHHQRSLNNNQNPPSMLSLDSDRDENLFLITFDLAGEVVQQWITPYSHQDLGLDLGILDMIPFPSESKLICFNDRQNFFLYNPSTRRNFRLPDPSFNSHFGGFGYVPSSDEYVIVYMSISLDCQILTLSISKDDHEQLNYNDWRSVEVGVNILFKYSYSYWGVFVCGALYWTIFDRGQGDDYLLSFDPGNEVFSTVRMPLDFQDDFELRNSPLEIKGELYFMSQGKDTLKLWKLTDVKNQIWTQSFTHCFGRSCNSDQFNREVLRYRLKYLQDHEEPYKILRDFGELGIENKLMQKAWGIGIHTNLFSL